MPDHTYLTIDEVAAALRVHRNTVYRWCRTGVVPAAKLGKEWRISAATLRGLLEGGPAVAPDLAAAEDVPASSPSGDLAHFIHRAVRPGDHLIGLVKDESEVYETEVAFFRAGLRTGRRLFKATWWQSRAEVRSRLAEGGLDVEQLEYEGRLQIADLARVFARQGPEAAGDLWVEGARRARLDGFRGLWGEGSPHLECCGGHQELLTFERTMDAGLAGQGVVAMCTYVLDHSLPDALGRTIDLMRAHSGTLLYSEGRGLLTREALPLG
ncbi:MAG: MEDS domain-containing protein [Thermoleophilia bacterium]|nr:MEDS domain-containing protein [Thermoleophilia bacterium]